jgi:putative oxidoreductase
MLWKLLRTPDDRMLFALRIVLGGVMFAHAAQTVFGWFGGAGIGPAMEFFTQRLSIPAPLAALAIGAEFLGSLSLLFGALGRAGAVAIACIMAVAALLVHWPYGFFMNWSGGQAGEGFEYHISAIALASLIAVRGSGAWSVDRFLLERFAARSSKARFGGVSTPGAFEAGWMRVVSWRARW